MMKKTTEINKWMTAFRLPTLPLSLSGVMMAIGLAYDQGVLNIPLGVLLISTAATLQILSNLANDYGDGVKGTDKHRTDRGKTEPSKLYKAMVAFALLSLILSLVTAFVALDLSIEIFVFVLIGVIAVLSAIKYTVGTRAYGYSGLGDIFVFIFFGILSVMGSYFLLTQEILYLMLLPATSVGLLSVAVLNLNNMRDYIHDKMSGKNTLVVKMGINNAKYYHLILIYMALICAILYNYINGNGGDLGSYLYAVLISPLYKHLVRVRNITHPKEFNPELKKVTLITFLFTILFCMGQLIT